MASEKILIVDDDRDMSEILGTYLKQQGYSVLFAAEGIHALEIVENEPPDLIVLDVMMPHLDGFELCQLLRKKTDVPVLFFSAKNEDGDNILGLGIGADDYIAKNTSIPVVVARIRAHLRRNRKLEEQHNKLSQQPMDAVIRYPGLVINLEQAVVTANGRPIKLSAKEYHLLCLLARNPDRVYSVEQLFALIWGADSLGDYRTVMVHISNIRKKLEEELGASSYIETLRGIGYKFTGTFPG
ncbi:response regulator transcription factor [Oceanobacillus kapialis]|uniref:Response regulator transcription factor n=1 Tax=Oceanobacillus kapialis TaxID=481353 RepID=A0ABW5Q2M7_9BACI